MELATSFAASLAAFYKIKIAHVEAGLRSFVLDNPWPEEFVLKSNIGYDYLPFCSYESFKKIFIIRRVLKKNIIVTGNTVIDSLFLALKK